jgi:AcrR family transcriptional regulator
VNVPALRRQPQPFFAEFIEGRRGQILDAAVDVFSRKGYEGGTMHEIAAMVGVTEPALYRHFASKHDLFATLLETAGGRIRSEAVDLVGRIRPYAIRDSLLAALDDRREALRRYAPVMRTMVVAASHDEDSMRVLRATVVLPIITHVAIVVRDVDVHFGLDRSDEQRADATRAFASLFVGTVVTSLVLGDSPDSQVVDAMLRVMGWG